MQLLQAAAPAPLRVYHPTEAEPGRRHRQGHGQPQAVQGGGRGGREGKDGGGGKKGEREVGALLRFGVGAVLDPDCSQPPVPEVVISVIISA